jgi:2-amino-4-hydroxy-6-hydroxymethyldihydropteridine diphosphokinase
MKSQRNITLEDELAITAIIGLGSNLDSTYGDSREVLRLAIKELSSTSLRPVVRSSFYESDPVDCPEGSPRFINAVVAVFLPIDFDGERFHIELQRIEKKLGRRRAGLLHEPRTIDLDLLYFGHKKISTSLLEVPHPRVGERRFVLLPLAEIAPKMVLPGQDLSVIELLQRLPQTQMVRGIPG